MRLILIATVSALALSACGKKSKSSNTPAPVTTIGYPDLSKMDEFAYASDVSPADSCYTHEWKRLLVPKGIDIHTGSDLVKSQLYVEVKSKVGCLGLIPLKFESSSNAVQFQFDKAILKDACPAHDASDDTTVSFRYLQGTVGNKRHFMFSLSDREEYCDDQYEDSFEFSE
jgi:hypothetical protein